MDFDKYQQAWKAQSDQTRVTLDANLVLQAVQRSHQNFRITILMRDYREVLISLLMLPFWFIAGAKYDLPWTWYLTVPTLLWLIGFILVDRKRHPQKPSEPGEPLLQSVQESLSQIEHQIYLLKNVFWWYLLPFIISVSAFFIHTVLLTSRNWLEFIGFTIFLELILTMIYTPIYYLNQYAVRKQLIPRCQELLVLLASLNEESANDVNDEYPILMSGESVRFSKISCRRLLGAILGFIVCMSIALGIMYLGERQEQEQGIPKLAPYSRVFWGADTPVVQIDEEWYTLVSLDGIAVKDIVAFSKQTYPNKWKMRFEEDLVEVLAGMGYAPKDTVTLVVIPSEATETQTLEAVPMTKANRKSLRGFRENREKILNRKKKADEGLREDQGESKVEPKDDSPLAEMLESIRASYEFPGMAAFVIKDGAIVDKTTVGERSVKDNTPLNANAQWHLGSNTKAMTATLAGILVAEGLLQWDSTIGEILGDAAPKMDEGNRDTTLTMLLSHRGGIPPNINWYAAPKDRVACVAKMLKSSPTSDLGSFAYSNGGYVVAGAMMEVVTGKTWENLMREKLFKPLGMNDSGFGAPSGPNAPWGHRKNLFGQSPMNPATRGSDNAPVLGPAGTVHTTLDDYARFVIAHLDGAQGNDGIVSSETFSILHTPPPGEDYALGWSIAKRSWADGQTFSHSGSNTMWYANAWLAPERNAAFFVVTNTADKKAFEATNKAIETLIGRHLE